MKEIRPFKILKNVLGLTRALPEDPATDVKPFTNSSASSDWFAGLSGMGGNTVAGVNVSAETAMRFSAVYACVQILSNSIAALPLQVYQKTPEGRRIATEHPVHKLLHRPNRIQTSFIFRETAQAHLCLWGNAYCRIEWGNTYRPAALHLYKALEVTPIVKDGSLYYNVPDSSVAIPARDILHIPGLSFDGIQGKSPITYARESIGLGLAAEEFGSSFFGNGANLSGVLEHPGTLSKEGIERLQASWTAKYAGIKKAHRTPVLENGVTYKPMSISPEDSQFIETRQFQIQDICRIFRVPVHMAGDLSRATFSNIEHQSLEFVQHTLMPWLKRWEAEINQKLFREDEQEQYYAEFNINGLLRGDAKGRAEYYKTMSEIGALTINEIRTLENYNKLPEGDKPQIKANEN